MIRFKYLLMFLCTMSNTQQRAAAVRLYPEPRRLFDRASLLQGPPCLKRSLLHLVRGGASSQSNPPSWRPPAPPVGRQRGSRSSRAYPTVQDVTSTERAKDTAASKILLNAFLTRESRNTFIARVYAILAGQLLVTTISIFIFGSTPNLRYWMLQKGRTVSLASLGLSTISWLLMCSDEKLRRTSPRKWQLLALFTLGEAISVGFISSFYAQKSVLSAIMATIVATLGVTMYTLLQRNPAYDLSQWGAGLASAGITFLFYGILNLLEKFGILPVGFLPYNEQIYSFLGASMFSMYLAYHTRLIVSGKHTKYQMNEKDYVFGAMTLYNDIINIFIYLLRLLGEDRDKQH